MGREGTTLITVQQCVQSRGHHQIGGSKINLKKAKFIELMGKIKLDKEGQIYIAYGVPNLYKKG